jgi:hypothetical protein
MSPASFSVLYTFFASFVRAVLPWDHLAIKGQLKPRDRRLRCIEKAQHIHEYRTLLDDRHVRLVDRQQLAPCVPASR